MKRRDIYPSGWTRTDNRAHGKTGARYRHVSGWSIEHCGHPTALWPLDLHDPTGARVLAYNGRAWRSLDHCFTEVAGRLAGHDEATRYRDYCNVGERKARR